MTYNSPDFFFTHKVYLFPHNNRKYYILLVSATDYMCIV